MTIGQRIGQRRKLLGLSQEGLGEKLGVSRQAISKWEADSAVPEIDKLIAMSKLFGVSVGWLLGTEPDAAEKTEPERFSDDQLRTIEQIVEKYRHAPVPETPRGWKAAVMVGTMCILFALGMSLAALLRETPKMPNYQNQLDRLNDGYAGLQSQIGYLTNQLEALSQGEKLLLEYGVTAEPMPDLSGATVSFTGIPNKWLEGDQAYLSVRTAEKETAQVLCVWNGTGYTAQTQVSGNSEYQYVLLVCHGDGSREQEILKVDHYAQHPAEGLRYSCDVDFRWQASAGKLEISSAEVNVGLPTMVFGAEDARWETAELALFLNGKQVAKLSVLDAEEVQEPLPPGTVVATPEDTETGGQHDVWIYKKIAVGWSLQMQNGDKVTVSAYMKGVGLDAKSKQLAAWSMENGRISQK